MGPRLAHSALANACFLALLAGSLTVATAVHAQQAGDAPAEQPAVEPPQDSELPTAQPPTVKPSPSPAREAQAGDAEQGPIALHWVRLPGTERCIAGDALARVVESKLRRSVFPAARDATVLIEGHVRKTEQGYAAELHMRDQRDKALGSRELVSQDESCKDLSDTLGVVLAVMIDPDAATRPARPPPTEKEPSEVAPTRSGGDENRMLAFGRAVFAITKEALFGFGTAYERALGDAGGLRVEVALFADNRRPFTDVAMDAAVLVRVTYAGVAYCPLWLDFTRTRLSGCAGLELGAMRGHDSSFPVITRDRQGLWASGSASLRLAIPIVGALEAHVAAGLLGVFGHRFVVAERNGDKARILPQHDVPLGAQLDLGLGARF